MKVMKRAAALLVVLVIGLLSACSSAAPQRPGPRVTAPQEAHELTKQDVDAWLDGQLPDALQHGEIPGAVVTVVHNGQVLTNRGYGYAATGADGEEPQPVDPERTLFRIGSTSKLVTGIAVMQLVEQGKIDLDADISTYVDVKIDRRFPGDITMRNLLTHTAGFEERARGTISYEQREFNLDEHILQDPPVQVFAPGTTPAYSNYGISLAGYIVQQVSGEKFEDYLDKHVFEPAGMTSATFHQPLPAELADRMAHGYQTNGGPAQPFELLDPPAGAGAMSGADAARFMLAQLGQSQGSPLLQDSTWQQMQSQASYTEPLGTLTKGDHMGLVYWDLSRNGHRIVGHGGDTLAFHTMLEIYPDDNTGVFISMNAAGKNGAPGTIRSDLMRAFSDRYFPGEQTGTGQAPTAEESAQHATTVAGNYATTRSPYTTFLSTYYSLPNMWTNISALANGHLLVKSGSATTEYEEIEPWVWREVGGSKRLPVQVEDGKVVRIGVNPATSIAPVTPAQAALVPVVLASGAALLLLIIAWPVGGIRRWWTTRQGQAVLGGGPLTWKAHLARTGGVIAVTAPIIWFTTLMSSMTNLSPVPPLTIRGIQALSLLGVLAIIPAAMDLIHVIRHKAGVRRIIGASLLLAGLAGLAWVAFAFHLISLDISY